MQFYKFKLINKEYIWHILLLNGNSKMLKGEFYLNKFFNYNFSIFLHISSISIYLNLLGYRIKEYRRNLWCQSPFESSSWSTYWKEWRIKAGAQGNSEWGYQLFSAVGKSKSKGENFIK